MALKLRLGVVLPPVPPPVSPPVPPPVPVPVPVPVVPSDEEFWTPHPSSNERKAMIIIVPNISGKRFNFLDMYFSLLAHIRVVLLIFVIAIGVIPEIHPFAR
jgi:hypothetical protein